MKNEIDNSDSDVLAVLLNRSQQNGSLSMEDIFELIPDDENSAQQLETVLAQLQKEGIEVLPEDTSDDFDFSLDDDLDEFDEDLDEDEFELELEDFVEADEDCEFELSYRGIGADDSVGLYLKEMARVPLLSLQQEVELAARLESGKKAAQRLQSGKAIGLAERTELLEVVEDGNEAHEHLIKANTRLVVSIAKKYMSRGVQFLDIIQEGNLGLMKAVEKFDYRRGFRFSTYATWWIRQTITRAIADQGRTIRVPVHMSDRIRRMYKSMRNFEQEYGRKPIHEELAVEIDMDPRKVEWMMRVSWKPMSLEQPIGEDDDAEVGSFIEDDTSLSPSQTATQSLLRQKMEEVLSTLSPREARILRLRFGLLNGRTYTLEEVGQKFGLTRERIRQIEGKALRRLRHPRRSRHLRDYL